MSSTFTDYLTGEEEYTLEEFLVKFEDALPQVVCVTQGYCAEERSETLDQGQILRIEAVEKERRVFANVLGKTTNKFASINLGSASHFECNVDNNKVITGTINDIIQTMDLPFIIRTKTLGNNGGGGAKRKRERFYCFKVYDHVCLLANLMSKVRLFVDVQVLPVHLSDIRITPVLGVKGFDQNVWDDFKQNLARATATINFKESNELDDIIYYDRDITENLNAERVLSGTDYCRLSSAMAAEADSHNYDYLRRRETVVDQQDGSDHRKSSHIYHTIHDLNLTELSLTSPAAESRGKLKTFRKLFKRKKSKHNVLTISSPLPFACPSLVTIDIPSDDQKLDLSSSTPNLLSPSFEPRSSKPELPPRVSAWAGSVDSDFTSSTLPRCSRSEKTKQKQHQEIIQGYSIKDVGDILEALGLERHVESFHKASIDGVTLSMLSKQILREEFGMKHYEAIKLRNFIRKGHIPR